MKIWEAMKAVYEDRLKVRHKHFPQDTAIYFNKDNKLMWTDDHGGYVFQLCSMSDSYYDGWEIVEEAHDFLWACKQMNEGYRVKRKSWDFYIYQSHVPPKGYFSNGELGIWRSDTNARILTDDYLATDWIIAK